MCRRASGGTDTIGCFVFIVFCETEATWREGKMRGVHVYDNMGLSSEMQYTPHPILLASGGGARERGDDEAMATTLLVQKCKGT
jgi:hypothetical protein